ncbi:hypothetical protein Tco_1522834, partial [Tanacetum coccineum]
NIRVNLFTMKMEILLESTSNKLMVEHAEYDESNTYVLERFNTTAGNPVKKILLKLNLSDHRVAVHKGQSLKMALEIVLGYDLKMLKITMTKTSARNKLNQELNDHYNISHNEESQEYELRLRIKHSMLALSNPPWELEVAGLSRSSALELDPE